MSKTLKKIETLINSELTSKIKNSLIDNEELTIEASAESLIEVIQFLKSNEKCKFRQLIDIAGVDYPSRGKTFSINLSFFIS